MLEVQPHVVTVLADTAIRAHDLDEAQALEAKERAERMLADPWTRELHPEKVRQAESGVHSCRVDDAIRVQVVVAWTAVDDGVGPQHVVAIAAVGAFTCGTIGTVAACAAAQDKDSCRIGMGKQRNMNEFFYKWYVWNRSDEVGDAVMKENILTLIFSDTDIAVLGVLIVDDPLVFPLPSD